MKIRNGWTEEAFETASKALLEILNTPLLTSAHFEFDFSLDEPPKITYKIERLSLKVPEKENE